MHCKNTINNCIIQEKMKIFFYKLKFGTFFDIFYKKMMKPIIFESGLPYEEHLLIRYKNKGETSLKHIKILNFTGKVDGDVLLKCRDWDTDEYSTLLMSKIITAIHYDTSEVLENPFLYYRGIHGNYDLFYLLQIIEQFGHEIFVLNYVGHIDGTFRKNKKDIITNFILSKTEIDIDINTIEKHLTFEMIESQRFFKSLSKIKQNLQDIEKDQLLIMDEQILKTNKKNILTDPLVSIIKNNIF